MHIQADVCTENIIDLRFVGGFLDRTEVLLNLEEALTLYKQVGDAIFICQNYPQENSDY
jgi:hypothetical protein